jgi:mannose-6-phosphate isomerase-like protein (cupin superfamily)
MSTAGMSTAGMSTEGSLTSDGPPPYRLVRPHEGQAPKGTPHLFKAAASNTAGRFDFVTASFAPRTGPPLHLHLEQDDTFYVLDGVLTVQAGDDIFDIGPGDFLTIPPQVPHTFDNLHNEDRPVLAINIMTPGGHFEMFEEIAAVEAGPDQADAVKAAAARHGTVVLGPPLRVALGLEEAAPRGGDPPGRPASGSSSDDHAPRAR